MTTKTARAYLVLTPRWWAYGDQANPSLSDFRISRLSQKRPNHIKADELVMKITVEVPDQAFKPLSPEVVINVPEDMLMTGEAILASAGDPHDTD